MGIFFAKQQLSKIAVSSHNNNINHTAISNTSTPFIGVSQCRYCNSSSLAQPTSLLGMVVGLGEGDCAVHYSARRAPKICTVLTRTVCTRPKKNYLKVLVQIFFDCSLVDLFINLCVIICDKI